MNDQRRQKLSALAAQMTAKANADRGLDRVAAILHVPVQASGAISRRSATAGLSPAIVAKIFAAPAGTAVGAPSLQGNAYTLALVNGVTHPNLPAQNPLDERLAVEIGRDAGSDMTSSLAQAWRNALGVTVNQSQVDRVSSGS
jgi:hypothetical protein